MSGLPDVATLYQVTDATWPAAHKRREGPWMLREGQGGGSRVSATTVAGEYAETDIAQAEAAMQAMGQPRLFMIRQGDSALDAMLEARGYGVVDPVNLYVAPVGPMAARHIPRVCAFTVWEPLAIQIDIWAAGGIGPARIAVMKRAPEPKTSLLGRLNDSPAATGFVGIHNGIAMVHALEILKHQRKQGMGGFAMARAARWAQDQGASHISLVVTQANVGGNALYSSLGMECVGQYHYRKHREDIT